MSVGLGDRFFLALLLVFILECEVRYRVKLNF